MRSSPLQCGGPDREIFPVIRLDVPLMPVVKSIRDTQTLPVLERTLREGGYDIVHAHNAFSPMSHLSTYLARRLNIPSVFTLHSVLRGAGSVLSAGAARPFPETIATCAGTSGVAIAVTTAD